MRHIREMRRLIDQTLTDFHTWAAELDRRNRQGDFGKYPWQKQYADPQPTNQPA
jgi:hypothetical protein